MTHYSFKLFIVILLLSPLVFSFSIVNAEVPAEYQNCQPIVTNFTVSPTSLVRREQEIRTTTRVETVGCIIRGDVLGGSKWAVRIEFVNDNGSYYGDNSGYTVPTEYIRGSQFARISNNTASPDYNKYFATYNVSVPSPFVGRSGNSVTLRPNVYWDYGSAASTRVIDNISLQKKITTSQNNNTNINSNTTNANTRANVNTQTGANFNMDLDSSQGSFFNPLAGSVNSVPQLITSIIRILFVLIGILSVVIIIVSGFRMVISSGNQDQITKAKKAITWAIIGLIVSLLSFSIVSIIQRLIQVGAN